MGYGPVINGKQMPITPWKGSWAEQEQAKKAQVPTTCSIRCTHGKGLACPHCYDQRFGANWKG